MESEYLRNSIFSGPIGRPWLQIWNLSRQSYFECIGIFCIFVNLSKQFEVVVLVTKTGPSFRGVSRGLFAHSNLLGDASSTFFFELMLLNFLPLYFANISWSIRPGNKICVKVFMLLYEVTTRNWQSGIPDFEKKSLGYQIVRTGLDFRNHTPIFRFFLS